MRELPFETYMRITGEKWPGGRSQTIRALLLIFGIQAMPGSAEANLLLQERIHMAHQHYAFGKGGPYAAADESTGLGSHRI